MGTIPIIFPFVSCNPSRALTGNWICERTIWNLTDTERPLIAALSQGWLISHGKSREAPDSPTLNKAKVNLPLGFTNQTSQYEDLWGNGGESQSFQSPTPIELLHFSCKRSWDDPFGVSSQQLVFGYSQRWLWTVLFSGQWHSVVW
jgi:hypothetical protein